MKNKEEKYKLTVNLSLKSKHYLQIIKRRRGYHSLDKLIEDMIDEQTHGLFKSQGRLDPSRNISGYFVG